MPNGQRRARPLDAAVNPNAETASQQGPVPDDEAKRREHIAVAAYYNAERRGFRGGGEVEDWLEAERQIDAAKLPEGSTSIPTADSERLHFERIRGMDRPTGADAGLPDEPDEPPVSRKRAASRSTDRDRSSKGK